MIRDAAGQHVGIQGVDATTGAAFTGAVTCYVTGDGGTQALGSVGSGVCTHEGNGAHSYAPAQAETDYAHVMYTFIGTGMVPQTVQVYPSSLAAAIAALVAPDNAGIADAEAAALAALAAATANGVAIAALPAPDNAGIAVAEAAAVAAQAAGEAAFAILDEMTEDDGGTRRLTANALEQAPDSSAADWASGEREQIRSALGIDGTKTAATGGQLQAKADQTKLDTVEARLTAGRATALDFLDAAITSRSSFNAATDKITPIDVDGLTHAVAMRLFLALLGGKTVPSGSTVAFKARDGVTTVLTVTYGAADGERFSSVLP